METVLHPLLPTAIIPTVQANIRLEDRASFHTFFASSGNMPDVETASVAAIPNPEVEDETADREDGAGEAALDSETPENLAEDDAFEMPFQTQNTDNTAAKHPSVPPELVSGSKQPTDSGALAVKAAAIPPKPNTSAAIATKDPVNPKPPPKNETFASRSVTGAVASIAPAQLILSRTPVVKAVPEQPILLGAIGSTAPGLSVTMAKITDASPIRQRSQFHPSQPAVASFVDRQVPEQPWQVSVEPSTPTAKLHAVSLPLRGQPPLLADPVLRAQQANHDLEEAPTVDRMSVRITETHFQPIPRRNPSGSELPPDAAQKGVRLPPATGDEGHPQPTQKTTHPIAQTAMEHGIQTEIASITSSRPTPGVSPVASHTGPDFAVSPKPTNQTQTASAPSNVIAAGPISLPHSMSTEFVPAVSIGLDEARVEAFPPMFSHESTSTRTLNTAPLARLTLPLEAPDFPIRMADVLITKAGQQVEIALRPEELGSVRMALSFNETGAVVIIAAERAETLDLLRRHAEALADALRDLGHSSVGFSFGDMRQDADPQATSDASQGDPLADPQTSQHLPAAPALRLTTSGLDLRL